MKTECLNALLQEYDLPDTAKGDFLFKLDLLMENAVFPREQEYAYNLKELWGRYMPGYSFGEELMAYYKVACTVLQHIYEDKLSEFRTERLLKETAIRNYLKYQILQGVTDPKLLSEMCRKEMRSVANSYLQDDIRSIFRQYFPDGKVSDRIIAFSKNFYDASDRIFREIMERLTNKPCRNTDDIAADARRQLAASYSIPAPDCAGFLTTLNILLCRSLLSGSDPQFPDHLKKQWAQLFPKLPYSEQVEQFVRTHEDNYFLASSTGIKGIQLKSTAEALYLDALILHEALEAALHKRSVSAQAIKTRLNKERLFPLRSFNETFRRMKEGLEPAVLLRYQTDIKEFHYQLQSKLLSISNEEQKFMEMKDDYQKRLNSAEARLAAQNADIIELKVETASLEQQLADAKAQIPAAEKRGLTELIRYLDDEKYGHVLGKLYRIAYSDDEAAIQDARKVLNNFFELLKMHGIETFGEMDQPVSRESIEAGDYRLDHDICEQTVVLYPGYQLEDSVILKPFVGEK
ncbi:MAG: hypothetical protein K5695_10710 [Oscillospiraceae bacterium]|nr:hypothetical protein [Oscillospiraceae bacterium]